VCLFVESDRHVLSGYTHMDAIVYGNSASFGVTFVTARAKRRHM